MLNDDLVDTGLSLPSSTGRYDGTVYHMLPRARAIAIQWRRV